MATYMNDQRDTPGCHTWPPPLNVHIRRVAGATVSTFVPTHSCSFKLCNPALLTWHRNVDRMAETWRIGREGAIRCEGLRICRPPRLVISASLSRSLCSLNARYQLRQRRARRTSRPARAPSACMAERIDAGWIVRLPSDRVAEHHVTANASSDRGAECHGTASVSKSLASPESFASMRFEGAAP